jgi:hypothetical protein
MRPPARETRRKTSIKPQISKARLKAMIEEATVDCHDESEQATGWFTMLDEHLAVPFETKILGVLAIVERVDLNRGEQIIAVCSRGRDRQSLPILDLPLPRPLPAGAEWIAAYRHWRGEG